MWSPHTMAVVIQLDPARRDHRKRYNTRYQKVIDAFIDQFLSQHIAFNLEEITHLYRLTRSESDELAWDYQTFRDVLHSTLEATIGSMLLEEIRVQPWYDRRFLSLDELIDRCMSRYLLNQTQSTQALSY